MRQMSEAVDNTNSGTDRAEGRCPINDRVENNLDFLMKHQQHGRTSPHTETIENLSSLYDVYKKDKKKNNHKPSLKRCPINDRVENNLDFLMKHQHHGRTSPHIETIENLSSQYDVYKQDKKKNHKPHFKRGLRKMFKTKSQKKVVETSSA